MFKTMVSILSFGCTGGSYIETRLDIAVDADVLMVPTGSNRWKYSVSEGTRGVGKPR